MNRYLKNNVRNVRNFLFKSIFARHHLISIDDAIFTFTFDDVPVSAYKNGARILEKYGALGTYYISLGMGGEDDYLTEDSKYLNVHQIHDLYQRGHDIACHTYSHLDLNKVNSKKIVEDCKINRQKLSRMIDGRDIKHFSYPFGKVSLKSKKLLKKHYQTMRTINEGLNVGDTDMTYLSACSLNSRNFDKYKLLDIIEKTTSDKTWTIFYTHDVSDTPSEWGVTVEEFEWLVKKCSETTANILSIEKAYKKITN